MPASAIQFGDQVVLEVNDGVAAAFVAITELETLTPPGNSRKMVERKRLGNIAIVERVASPRVDPGDITATYEITDALALRLAALDGVSKSYRVTWPDGLRLAVTGTMYEEKPAGQQAEGFSMGAFKIACQSLIAVTDSTP
jgi:hypothetical protein